MDSKLHILPELLVELLVIVLLLSYLGEHLQAFLHQVLLDHAENLVLLKSLARDVQWKVLRVHHSLHEAEPFWDELVTIVHDEHSADVKLDVVALLLALKHVKRRAAWHKEERPELELPLDAEVLHRKMVLPIVREGLVERGVFLIRDVLGLPHPQGLVLIQLLPFMRYLLDLLGLLLLFLLLLLLLVYLLDLRLITLSLILLLLLLVLGVSHLLLLGLLDIQLNGEANEL